MKSATLGLPRGHACGGAYTGAEKFNPPPTFKP